VRKQRLGGYSGGMRQRFGVAVAVQSLQRHPHQDIDRGGVEKLQRNHPYRVNPLFRELGAKEYEDRGGIFATSTGGKMDLTPSTGSSSGS
jgi:hypothetical protein